MVRYDRVRELLQSHVWSDLRRKPVTTHPCVKLKRDHVLSLSKKSPESKVETLLDENLYSSILSMDFDDDTDLDEMLKQLQTLPTSTHHHRQRCISGPNIATTHRSIN